MGYLQTYPGAWGVMDFTGLPQSPQKNRSIGTPEVVLLSRYTFGVPMMVTLDTGAITMYVPSNYQGKIVWLVLSIVETMQIELLNVRFVLDLLPPLWRLQFVQWQHSFLRGGSPSLGSLMVTVMAPQLQWPVRDML
jgi:hypothetical protein